MGERKEQTNSLEPFVLGRGEGRSYPMGRMSAVFKADLEETNSALSISEWELEANTEGPPLHAHPEAHMFYVISGRLAVYVDGKDWFETDQGAYVYIPGGYQHGFENRSDASVRFMSINTPGGFESSIPHIVDYFKDQPLGNL